MAKRKKISERGILFVFNYDPDDDTLLHIYARHLTTPSDALDCFFDGTTVHNPKHDRFESRTAAHCCYWFWLEEQKVVMVITCFTI